MLPTISTPRLRLRALTVADVSAVYSLYSDREATRHWSEGTIAGLDDAAALVERAAEGAREGWLLQWGLCRRHDDAVLGTCMLGDVDRTHRRASLGYLLAPAEWGQGLAREAVRAVLAFGFGELGLHRIAADVDPDNARSLRLLTALGFEYEGLQRECHRVRDGWRDAAMYARLRA